MNDTNTCKIYYKNENNLNKFNNVPDLFLLENIKTDLEELTINDRLNEDIIINKLYLRKKNIC